ILANVVERDDVGVVWWIVRSRRPVPSPVLTGTNGIRLARLLQHHILVDGNEAGFVDAFNDVLVHSVPRPIEIAGLGIELPHLTVLAGYTRQDAAGLAAWQVRAHGQHPCCIRIWVD